MRRNLNRIACAALTLAALTSVPTILRADALEDGFKSPPASAKPQTWWHWMNGNVTKEGITLDLEAMHRVGVGGAEIFIADCGIPAGDVKFMSPQFREMIEHAAKEADRLGMELEVHNCAGWSSSGGPWVKPENAMQFVVTSETHVTGPAKFDDELPMPATKLGEAKVDYYRDIAVLAFKSTGGAIKIADYAPKATTSGGATGDAAALFDAKSGAGVTFDRPAKNKQPWVRIELAKPLTARAITLTAAPGLSDFSGQIELSEDGQTFTPVRPFQIRRGTKSVTVTSGDDAVTARFLRIRIDKAGARTKRVGLAGVAFSDRAVIDNAQAKAGYQSQEIWSQQSSTDGKNAVSRDGMIDLTDHFKDGKLTWDAPEGDWVVMRIGHTPTGKNNHPAPKEATGLECDKLSKAAFDAFWDDGYMGTILKDLGPLAGKSLYGAVIDSYEVGGQNWTPKMREEFRKRRGYDMTKFLPAMAGVIVDSPEASDRFLWDLRQTISELYAENYYGHFAERCHRAGLKASIEPYDGPYESLLVGKPADIPMGEFWTGSQGHRSVKLATSVGHIYGKKIIGTESFTAAPPAHGRWQESPYSFKALGDLMETWGVNRFIFHRFAMQPWTDKYPGMTMGQWGFHFDRTNTWFEQSTGWLNYLAHAQYMLQQGRFVADVAFFSGEGSPSETRPEPLPKGYDWDAVNYDVLKDAKVDGGRIVLGSGVSYAVLSLPPSDGLMTPEMAETVKRLVDAGATVRGEKPKRSPSLSDYPKCDEDVKTIAAELWDGGKVKAAGTSFEDVFAKIGLKPDFEVAGESPRAKIVYCHRHTDDGADIYFVSNQRETFEHAACTFRVAGKAPELWYADSGAMVAAPAWEEQGGRTTVDLELEPAGSVFVVFRKKDAAAGAHLASIESGGAGAAGQVAPKLVIDKAVYEATDGAGSRDVTRRVAAMAKSDDGHVEANNGSLGGDPAYLHAKRLRVEYTLDGKAREVTVGENDAADLVPAAAASAPAAEWVVDNGKATLIAWSPAAMSFTSTDGNTTKGSAQVSAPKEVTGPWTVAFPPDWGAPASITLNALESWTDNADDGVKYFSGTATYTKPLDVPAELLSADKVTYLDLGRVKDLARVKLNGKDLGIVWKPPFRVRIDGVAHAGANDLEVKITNEWANRLIGDDRLPADVQWNGIQLAGWPEWLKEGKKSPTGRLTFTTWHHWTKEMKPLESGLIGPVTIKAGTKVQLPR